MNNKREHAHSNNLKVTIGVCVKNGAATVEKAIDSIINQDFPHKDMEIIFVNDGSQDNTLSVIQNYIPKLDMPVKLFTHRWSGLGVSRDIVVDNASGEYIIWVDCDMTLSKDFVTKQVAFMDENPTVGIAKGQYGLCAQDGLAGYLENIEFVAAHISRRGNPNSLPLGTGGSIYRVTAIRQAGGFDHKFKGSGEDVDAEHRVRIAGWSLEATAPVFYEKRRGTWGALWTEYFWLGKSRSNLFDNERQLLNIYRLWPPVTMIVEFSRVITAYKLTRCKTVFLMPLHFVFKRVAWFLGIAMIFLGEGKVK
ncbi:MAG: glycosyltransferase [Promethearchaeota archaeon]